MVTPPLEYSTAEGILFVNNFAKVRFDTRKKIDSAFDECERFWKLQFDGEKLYCVIDYTSTWISRDLVEYFNACRSSIVPRMTHATVRWGADFGTRVTLRAMAVKTHVPSNVYETRDEAVA